MLRSLTLKLVLDLVLKRSPEIHGNSPYLNFHLNINDAVRQIHRQRHYHVIAAIAAGLRIHDVILNSKDLNVLLVADHLSDPVNIRCKRAYDTNTSYVIDVAHHVLDGGLIAVSLKLFYYALRSLDSCLNVLDGVISVNLLELLVKDLDLGLDLLEGRVIKEINFLPGVNVVGYLNIKSR